MDQKLTKKSIIVTMLKNSFYHNADKFFVFILPFKVLMCFNINFFQIIKKHTSYWQTTIFFPYVMKCEKKH